MHKPKSRAELMIRGRVALGISNKELAERMGCSRRTMQRWMARQSYIVPVELAKLAGLVAPHDRALAEEIAQTAGQTLEALGHAPPAPPRPPLPHLGHAVVCVAAEAMDLSPRALRPALHAAFKCARDLGLTVEELELALAPVAAAPKRAAAK